MKVPKRFKDPKNVWAALGLAAVYWELYCIVAENGGTFTEANKALWKLDTPRGKWAFLALYGAVVSWFPAHALKEYDWTKNPALYEVLLTQIGAKIRAR